MSVRLRQAESTLQREVSALLQRRLADPRIEGMVSVTRVELSPDYHDARVHVSVMPARYEAGALEGLNHASGYVRRLLRKRIAFRVIPRIEFRLDRSLKEQAEVYRAIDSGIARETPPDEEAPE